MRMLDGPGTSMDWIGIGAVAVGARGSAPVDVGAITADAEMAGTSAVSVVGAVMVSAGAIIHEALTTFSDGGR